MGLLWVSVGRFRGRFGPREAHRVILHQENEGKRRREETGGEERRGRGVEQRASESSGLGVRARTEEEAMEGPPKASTRRRRLVERGSDRLAFITGQASALPSDPYPDSPLSSTASSQLSDGGFSTERVSNFQKSEHRDLLAEIQPTGDSHLQKPKHKAHSSEGDVLQKFQISSGVPEIQPVYEPLVRSHDDGTLNRKTNDYVPASVQPRREVETRPRSVPPNQPDQSDDSSWSLESLKQLVDFSPHEITHAISATEFNRMLASILIAFVVVLSNWGLDVGGIITRILVGTRPLLFLIITNITLVITFMMENKEARGRQAAGGGLGSADSLMLMLELGSLAQKAFGALLIDVSVCAVIMICFLGF